MNRGWLFLAGLILGGCGLQAPALAGPASVVRDLSAGGRPAPAAKAAAKPRAKEAAKPVAAVPAPPPEPPMSEADRQLQAIRQALLESTTAAPVRVQSYGWIDTEGRLHESTQFTSDTQVRGVRVLSYVGQGQAAEPAPRVEVDASVLPAGVGPRAAVEPGQCLDSARRWRLGLHVEVSTAPGVPASLAPQVQGAFVAAAHDSRRWLAQSRPYQPVSAYEQALLGREADRTEWLARITLRPGAQGVRAQVQVAPLQRPGDLRQVELTLSDLRAGALAAPLAEAVTELDRQSACEPMAFTVAGTDRDALRLREGTAHGLQPGDRLLLVQRQHLPGRLLDPGAVRALALVQVAETSQAGTSLRWLAGPRPSSPPGDWVALPL